MIRVRPGDIFDGYVRRLLQSANPRERDSVYAGYTVHHEYPVLVPIDLLFEHMHILGAPGTGKSALGLAPLITQLVRRNDGPVIVLDLKGDMALFNTVRLEAENSARKFKWFTNKPYRSTYVFNPWQQAYLERLTLQEILGLFLLSLNMHHGDDYGRAYFGMKARKLFQDSLKTALDLEHSERSRRRRRREMPESFVDLAALLKAIARSDEEYRQGDQLINVVQSLIDFRQLNLSPGQGSDSAAKHAIHMPEVIQDKQVVYFWLQALIDTTSVAEIARLVLYSALSAAVAYRDQTGKKPRVYLIADEAQHLIAQNIANVLAQAREYQVGCVLAHQAMSQLNPPGGVDLRDLVLSCTSIKQFWSARDPELKDHISKISGEVGYYSASWDQFKRRISNGDVGRQYAASRGGEGEMYVRVAESVGPRLTSQDIEDYSRQPNTNILSIERNVDFSCFQGAFPVHMDWIMSADEFHKRNLELAWPDDTDETIVTEGVGLSRLAEQDSDGNALQTDVAEANQTTIDKLDELHKKVSRRQKGKR